MGVTGTARLLTSPRARSAVATLLALVVTLGGLSIALAADARAVEAPRPDLWTGIAAGQPLRPGHDVTGTVLPAAANRDPATSLLPASPQPPHPGPMQSRTSTFIEDAMAQRATAPAPASAGSAPSDLPVGTFTFGITPKVTADLKPQHVEPGESFELSVTAEGDEAPSARWQASDDGETWVDVPGGEEDVTPTRVVDGVGTPGTNIASLELQAPEEAGASHYRAVFANALGSVTSAAARVTVGIWLDLDAATIEAAPSRIVGDGRSTSTITVTLVDSAGSPATGHLVRVVPSRGTATDAVEQSDGTYTSTLTSSKEVGPSSIAFTVDGVAAPKRATVDFVAGAPSLTDSTIAANPTSITADGASTSRVTVQVLDEMGHPVPGREVEIVSDAGQIAATNDNFDGTYSAVLTAPTTAGSAVLSFTVDGADAVRKAGVDFVAGRPSESRSTITASPETIAADGKDVSVITVAVLDENDNPVRDSDVVITSDGGDLTETTAVGDGTHTAVLSSGTRGQATLGFTVDGRDGFTTTRVGFVGRVPSLEDSTITAGSATLVVGGRDSTGVTVTVVDDHGDRMPGRRVVVTSTAGELAGVVDEGDGTYTTTLTSTATVGLVTLGFTIDGQRADATTTVAFVAGPASSEASTISAAPGSIAADGESTSSVIVRVRDTYNNPVAGRAVVISTTNGEITPTTDQGDGTYTATLKAPSEPGSALLGFTVDGHGGFGTTTVVFTDGDTSLTRSTITASPDEITADGETTSTVTVRVLDEHDRLVPGRDVVVMASAGSIGRVRDNGDGTHTATLRSSTSVEEAVLGFAVDYQDAPATATVRFVAGPPSAVISTIGAEPSSLEADGRAESAITVRALDAHANPVPGRDVVIASGAGQITGTTDRGDGTYTATLTSPTTAGTTVVGFTVDGTQGEASVIVTFTAGAVALDAATISADPTSIEADGRSTSMLTAVLVDAHGNAVPGRDVVIATDAGTVTGTTDEGDGRYTAVLTAPTAVGEGRVTFTVDGVDATVTETVTFTAVDGGGSGDDGAGNDGAGGGGAGGGGAGADGSAGSESEVLASGGDDTRPGVLALTGSQVGGLLAAVLALLGTGLILRAVRRSRSDG